MNDPLDSQVGDVDLSNTTDWKFVHIVNTRFMQEQGHLTTLAMARLHQFWSFCLPTMLAQTSQEFFWIIKTDPSIVGTNVFQKLLESIQSYPNIYLVASNVNFMVTPDQRGSWRDGSEIRDLLQSKIFSGDERKLWQAMALRNHLPVLETRLDADDGLNRKYLQYIQNFALKRFGGDPTDDGPDTDGQIPQWLYWCVRRHVEWHSSVDLAVKRNDTTTASSISTSTQDSSSSTLDIGMVNPVQHTRLCVTPGITVGFNVGVRSEQVPIEAHDLLYKHLEHSSSCYKKAPTKKEGSRPLCLDLVDDFLFSAVRSRTWTSAGMLDVSLGEEKVPKPAVTNKLWQFLHDSFHIQTAAIQETQQYLLDHKAQIAYENLLGQCTSSHSCKEDAKAQLRQYVQEAAKVQEQGHSNHHNRTTIH
eukprot:Nitzschia sp. Nitz4//scaffold118_size93875//27692//28942//NITZ4_004782-RA/size93875-processed-gene-0.57-mRNA-1//-1//CDS//3329533706//2452//frame0